MKSQGWINFVLSGQKKSWLPRKGNHLSGKMTGRTRREMWIIDVSFTFFGEEVFVGVPERCCSGDKSLGSRFLCRIIPQRYSST